MNIGMAGSLFIYGHEDYMSSNNILYTAEFKDKPDLEKVFASYCKMVRENPVLQSKWVRDTRKKSFAWERYSTSEVEALLDIEKAHITQPHSLHDIYTEFFQTNSRLPVGISLINEHTLVFVVNHVFTNHYAIGTWIEKWFRYYAREINEAVPAEPFSYGKTLFPQKVNNNTFFSPFWAVVWVLKLIREAGKQAGIETVDLTHGRLPDLHKSGYAFKTYPLTRAETEKVERLAQTHETSVPAILCDFFSKTLFDKYPEKKRICINFPVTLKVPEYGVDPFCAGNYSGSILFQVFRDKPIQKQISDALRWLERNVQSGIMKALGIMSANHESLRRRFEERAALPALERAPLENYTFLIAYIGEVKSPIMEKMLTRISATGKGQTIIVLPLHVNGKLTIDISVSKDLFDPDEVFAVTDEIVQRIKE